ncbi:HAMP domain-containing sensor histidine kinase [Neptunicoccus cionae]|uniref:HAMP domain-containing sensor histidine kinase n=1 Tax=Neptunicoccus cionae TaxID=2035344 RepID=UPI000C7614D9|nr:HAMP domain-containing sensor histidine kinase [Amylibacter cionae]PLS21501.1 two-component sensor histidine kinase [Amylibacter cionae]
MAERTPRRINLLQSTPLRLTVGLIALFALVSLISLGAAFLVIRDSMQQAMRSDLTQEFAGFQAAPTAGAVAALVKAEAAVTRSDRRILSYTAPDGRHYGNGYIALTEDGFRVLSISKDDDLSQLTYLAVSRPLYGGRLTIAISRAQIDNLSDFFIKILLLSVLPTTAIGMTAGLVLARRTARRIRAIGDTLDKMAGGDLGARVPKLSGRRDDLSFIATHVDRMGQAQQSSVAALKQVSADIAHDLKTPIQRVAVMLNQAREMPDLPPELEDLMHRAGQETEGIVATFQSLLQIAQIEGGSPKSRFVPVDLAKLAGTFVEVYEPSAEETGHSLTVTAPEGTGLTVMGDKALLGQVLANLIENALRHTPEGTPIDVRLDRSGANVVLTVADKGPGIPEQERDNVLRRLYRLEQSRTTSGSGLGLSLVSVIADLHEARLTLESNEPGLRVSLRFPPAPAPTP